MPREQFFHRESESLFKTLEQLSQRSGVSRGVAFEDWLTVIVCALAAETKEAEYLAMIERHKAGKPGKRGCDLMGQMFGELVTAMERTDADVLGDLFQGAITYGEAGQYFTPDAVTKLMARMTIDPDARPQPDKPVFINDPCCGTGRMLLGAANINSHVELVGQDVDARCVKITAINLGLRSRYGWVVCGNSLTGNASFAYRVGSFFHETPHGLRRGVIRDVPVEQTPVPVLAARVREQTQPLFAQEPETAAAAPRPMPVIIEVPRWLARLEPTLAASHAEPPAAATAPPAPTAIPDPSQAGSEQSAPPPDPPYQSQRRLF